MKLNTFPLFVYYCAAFDCFCTIYTSQNMTLHVHASWNSGNSEKRCIVLRWDVSCWFVRLNASVNVLVKWTERSRCSLYLCCDLLQAAEVVVLVWVSGLVSPPQRRLVVGQMTLVEEQVQDQLSQQQALWKGQIQRRESSINWWVMKANVTSD